MTSLLLVEESVPLTLGGEVKDKQTWLELPPLHPAPPRTQRVQTPGHSRDTADPVSRSLRSSLAGPSATGKARSELSQDDWSPHLAS